MVIEIIIGGEVQSWNYYQCRLKLKHTASVGIGIRCRWKCVEVVMGSVNGSTMSV